jgi:16S rRNA (cytidine1402-2'-O)-methyltransferase
MAELYMVATPIGNLKDITLRALEVLGEVDAIACEDTRHSLKLLNAHGIKKPLIACHAHNEQAAAGRITAMIRDGKSVAYVSDAGTPGISDPGATLVRSVREAGFTVVPIPGPSAMAAMLSVSSFPGKRAVFEGFLSPKGGRRKNQLKNLLALGDVFIVYESPFRIVKLLADLEALCDELDDQRSVLCGRELTKSHEEILEGLPGEIRENLENRPSIKGEFAVLVSGPVKRS